MEFEKRPEPLTSINRVASVFASKPPRANNFDAQDADDEVIPYVFHCWELLVIAVCGSVPQHYLMEECLPC